jgi:hypothetical protein
VTCVSLNSASLQVKHRKISGEITFYVEGIEGEQTFKWCDIDELKRLDPNGVYRLKSMQDSERKTAP